MLVCNPREGIVVIKNMAALPLDNRVPIISHWGITGAGRKFFKYIHDHIDQVDLVFLQSFSFIAPPFKDRASHVCNLYAQTFPNYKSPRDIFSPAGTAHAYELVHLLAKAIQNVNSIDRSKVRDALENLRLYEGIIRNYDPPFTANRHDALTSEDLHMSNFDSDGVIIPIDMSKLSTP